MQVFVLDGANSARCRDRSRPRKGKTREAEDLRRWEELA